MPDEDIKGSKGRIAVLDTDVKLTLMDVTAVKKAKGDDEKFEHTFSTAGEGGFETHWVPVVDFPVNKRHFLIAARIADEDDEEEEEEKQ